MRSTERSPRRSRSMTSNVRILAVVLLAMMHPVVRAAKCSCVPPSEAAKALGWWDDAAPRIVPKRDGDADVLTRELSMDEDDLRAILAKNAVQNSILLMFANLGALQLLENYLCSLSEQGINKYLIYAMDVESHMVWPGHARETWGVLGRERE